MLTFKAHKKPIYSLAFSPDGTHLATTATCFPTAEATRVWDLSDPIQPQEFPNSPSCRSVAFSPDGRFLARGGNRPKVWDLKTGRPLFTYSQWAATVAFAPDGREVAAFGASPLARWSLPAGKRLPGGWGGARSAHRFPALAMAYSPDGKTIATAYGVKNGRRFEPRIFLWERDTGELRLEIVLEFTRHFPTGITFSPDNSLLVGTFGPVLGVVDAKTGVKVAALNASNRLFRGLAFTPDGKKLVAINTNDTARVYDTATWSEVTGYAWNIGKLTSVAVAPDGLRAACGSHLGRVVVWDLE